MNPDMDIAGVVGRLLARTPEWVRHDLGSKDALARERAEETLALMIEAALRDDAAPQAVATPDQDEAA